MKPGWKTTEFWLVPLAPVVIGAIKKVWPEAPNELLYTLLGLGITYILSRAGVKMKNGG